MSIAFEVQFEHVERMLETAIRNSAGEFDWEDIAEIDVAKKRLRELRGIAELDLFIANLIA